MHAQEIPHAVDFELGQRERWGIRVYDDQERRLTIGYPTSGKRHVDRVARAGASVVSGHGHIAREKLIGVVQVRVVGRLGHVRRCVSERAYRQPGDLSHRHIDLVDEVQTAGRWHHGGADKADVTVEIEG